MTFELLAPFLIGLFGSLHCLGMCGPLVMAYSLHIKRPEISSASGAVSPWVKGLFHHLAFHLGRLLTYGLLGALAAALVNIVGFNLYLNVRGGFLLAAGLLITFLGLIFLKVLPWPAPAGRLFPGPPSLWNRFLPALFKYPGLFSKTALGLACGLLPCCLSASLLIKAATTENPALGFLTMIVFGLGTVPALLAAGLSASWLSLRARIIGERVAALSVMAMGLVLVYRGARLLM
jgi:sulfite exporter TauE/SafE